MSQQLLHVAYRHVHTPVFTRLHPSDNFPLQWWNSSLPVVKMGDFEFDIDLWKPGPCCGTRRMIYTKAETKRKRHGQKFLFVLKKTSKLYERLKKPILLSIAIIYWTQLIEIHTNMFFFYFMYSNVHTECFTTCGHYCRRWFRRSLWSKKFK